MNNMEFDILVEMLRTFYYEKNGLEDTIEFLKYIVSEMEKLWNVISVKKKLKNCLPMINGNKYVKSV